MFLSIETYLSIILSGKITDFSKDSLKTLLKRFAPVGDAPYVNRNISFYRNFFKRS